MLGMSAAVLQGLHDLRACQAGSPPKVVEMTTKEFILQQLKLGASDDEIFMAVRMMDAGATVGGPNGTYIRLKDEPPVVE